MNTQRGLTALIGAEEVAEVTGRLVLRTHAAEERPFVALLLRFGKAAAHDVQDLHEVLSLSGGRVSEAALGRGWRAAGKLAEKARLLPPGLERDAVHIELERAMQALLARDRDFAVGFTEAIEVAAAKLRGPAAEAAFKAAGRLLESGTPTAGAKVLARLARRIETAPPELQRLWTQYEAVAGAADGLRLAAEVAAKRARKILPLLRRRGLTAQQRLSQVWGHLSNIRGPLGEGYGLGNKKWLGRTAEEMAGTRKLAAGIGPGHTAEYLTQAAHNIRINGAEGPDAMAVIINRRAGRAYDTMRAQVKIAAESEGAAQSAKDIIRSAGAEAGRVPRPATITYTPAPGEDPVTLLLTSHPQVRPRLYLINAAGSRTPRADLDALKSYGFAVGELQLDLTVTHFTHLTLSVAESAIDLIKRVR